MTGAFGCKSCKLPHMSDEQAYELHGLRTDGSTYTVEVLGVQSPDAATHWRSSTPTSGVRR